jgi:inorganic pyrophosphatase
LISLRQKILAVPDNLCRKLTNIPDSAKARRILKETMISLLSELKNLPSAVTDTHWLKKLEADEGK